MYICKYCNRQFDKQTAYTPHSRKCEYIAANKDNILIDYWNGVSQRKLVHNYKISSCDLRSLLESANINIRNASDAGKNAHQLYPNSFNMSDATKQKIRVKRLDWMKSNPSKTAWRTRNTPSYPETLFMKICESESLYTKYDIVREYCVFPYFIDFAFVNAKVAIEIDGSQHWLNNDRISRDAKKDKILVENGWRVMRIPEFQLREHYIDTINDILLFLSSSDVSAKIYAAEIIAYEKLRESRINDRRNKQKLTKRRKLHVKIDLLNNSIDAYRCDYIANKSDPNCIKILGRLWGVRQIDVINHCIMHYGYVCNVHTHPPVRSYDRQRLIEMRRIEFSECYPNVGWSRKLGELWGMTQQAAARYCRKHYGIGCSHIRLTEADILKCFSQNMTLGQIGKLYSMSGSTVGDYCRKYNINIPKSITKVNWCEVNLVELIKQKSGAQIARELNVTPAAVYQQLRKFSN